MRREIALIEYSSADVACDSRHSYPHTVPIIIAKRLWQKRILSLDLLQPRRCGWHFSVNALEFRRRGPAFRLSSIANPLFARLRRLSTCQNSSALRRRLLLAIRDSTRRSTPSLPLA